MKLEIKNTIDEWNEIYEKIMLIEDFDSVEVFISSDDNLELLANLYFLYKYVTKFSICNFYYINVDTFEKKDDIVGKISALLLFSENDFKKKIKILNYKYNLFKNVKFNKISPLLFVDSKLSQYLMYSYDEVINNDEILNDANVIGLIDYIGKYTSEDDDIKDILLNSQKNDNLLTTFIMVYYFNNIKAESIQTMKTIAIELTKISYGIYQLLDNANKHSINNSSIMFFKIINLIHKNTKDDEVICDYLENNKKMYNYANNYGVILEDKKSYLFMGLLDCNYDFKNKKIVSLKDKIVKLGDINSSFEYFNNLMKIDKEKFPMSASSNYGIKLFLNACSNLKAQVRIHSDCEIYNYNVNNNSRIIKGESKYVKYNTGYEIFLPLGEMSIESSDTKCAYKLDYVKEYDKFSEYIVKTNISLDDSDEIKRNITEILITNCKSNNIFIFDFSKDFKKSIVENYFKGLFNFIYKLIRKIENNDEINVENILIKVYFKDNATELIKSRIYDILQLLHIFLYKIYNDSKIKYKSIEKISRLFQCSFFSKDENDEHYISSFVSLNWVTISNSFFDNMLYGNYLIDNVPLSLLSGRLYEPDVKSNNNVFKYYPFEISKSNIKNYLLKLKNYIINSQNGIHRENVNVRLNSGIYLDNFYEIEFIMQNDIIRNNFALLIYNDLNKIKNYKSTIIIGYENYSIKLCENLASFIGPDTKYVIYNENYNELQADYDHIIIIIPVTSTLKTLISILTRYNLFDKNVTVYSIFNVSPNDRNNSNIVQKFWKVDNDDLFTKIKLNCSKEYIVKNLLFLDSNWNFENVNPFSCVDNSSTLPESILFSEHMKIRNNNVFNRDRIRLLANDVYYGHVKAFNNHFNYFFNYNNIFKKNECESEIQKWLETITIENGGYNIIIAPLNEDNTEFLKFIIHHLFSDRIVLLQFKSFETRKDNFKNKYISILENIIKIKNECGNIKINYYFADTTISTGATFYRAKELMNYLFTKDGIKYFSNFTKAFLFLNRLSNNTLNTMLSGSEYDTSTNFESFISLNCPTFDTIYDECPDCKISQKYQILKGIGHDISNYLDDSIRKHQIVNYSEIDWDNIKDYKKNNDFIRLLLTHLMYDDLSLFDDEFSILTGEENDRIKDFFNSKIKEYYLSIKSIIDVDSEKTIKELYIKIMTRPMFTLYEKVFRIFYKFLKLEFEEALEKKNDKKYIELLTTRIAYSGTDLISKNEDKLKELDCDNTIITKSILWENAYKNGVI